jgi:hypothetical protein
MEGNTMAIDEAALLPAWREIFGDRWVMAWRPVEEANAALCPVRRYFA